MSAVVLLSAGLDSTYNLFRAQSEDGVVLALTFDYGQKAAAREIEKAAALCRSLEVPHKVVSLPWFRDFTSTSLVSLDAVPTGADVSIDDMEVSTRTKQAVWVPNRNGILLNIAAGFAEGAEAAFVVPGFNAEEAATFPDNSQAYLESLNVAFGFSTANGVRVKCYSTGMTKTQIVRDAVLREIPLDGVWPCYHAGETWCGECESCQRFERAAREGGAPEKLLKEVCMKTKFSMSEEAYDGSQLRSLYNYLDHGMLGDSALAWIAPCKVANEHMVDGEDLRAHQRIEGARMVHFIVELFDCNLLAGVAVQRLFSSIAHDWLRTYARSPLMHQLRRDGDDLYVDDRKLSISIATVSPVSALIHFAVNITNEGTPVETLSLEDLQVDPREFAEALLGKFQTEITTIREATMKVRCVR